MKIKRAENFSFKSLKLASEYSSQGGIFVPHWRPSLKTPSGGTFPWQSSG